MRHNESLLARCLIKLVEAVCRQPVMVLTVAVLVAGTSAYAFFTRLEYRTSRSDLISPDKECQKRMHEHLAEFCDEDDMVIVIRGQDRVQMMAAVDDLAARASSESAYFDRVFAKVDLSGLKDRALLFLPINQMQAIRENLDRMGPLLSAPIGPLAWRQLTLVNLLRQARERAGRLEPDSPLAPADEQFLTQLLATVRSANAALADPNAYKSPWGSLMPTAPNGDSAQLDAPQYFFSGDGKLAFLLVHPVKAKDSFTPAQAGVNKLRTILDDVRPSYSNLEFGLTGMPVLENDEMTATDHDSKTAAWIALIGTALLYAVAYRGLRYPLLTISTLIVGTALAMGWLTMTIGHLNILSAAFAVMLIGLGDYGVLWVMQYEQRRRMGENPEQATRGTAATIGTSIFVASLTTAMAFFATMLADFQAVAELGWIAGWGVMLCAFSCFTVLPALIRLTDRRGMLAPLAVVGTDGESHPVYAPQRRAPTWLPMLACRPRAVLATGLALGCIALLFANRVRYDHNLLNLQANGLDSVKWEKELIANMGGASWHALSHTATPEQAQALKARYEQLPGVSRAVEIGSLMPADQDRKLELVARIQRQLGGLPEAGQTITPLTPAPREVQKEATLLLGALQPFAAASSHEVLGQLVRGLSELQNHAVFHAGDESRDRLRSFETHLATDLLADLHRLKSVAHAAPIAQTDIPAELRERYIGKHGQWLVQVYAKEDLWDIAPMEQFAAHIQTVDPNATGQPFTTAEGLRAMQRGLSRAGLYALLVVIGVLVIDFRNWRYTTMALVPLASGAILLLGAMGLTGHNLNPANMIALPLIVGVGVNTAVHVLHDFRNRNRGGSYQLTAATGKGIAVSALGTSMGFGALMISQHQGMSGLGFVLSLGVVTCMAAGLVLLPAILRLVSDHRQRRMLRRAA